MLLYLKGLLAPFCGYVMVLATDCKSKKIRKIKVYCSISLGQFAERAQICNLMLLQKVICYPLDHFGRGIHELI